MTQWAVHPLAIVEFMLQHQMSAGLAHVRGRLLDRSVIEGEGETQHMSEGYLTWREYHHNFLIHSQSIKHIQQNLPSRDDACLIAAADFEALDIGLG